MSVMDYLSTYPSCPFTQINVDLFVLKQTQFSLSRDKDKMFDSVDIFCLQERTINFKSAISKWSSKLIGMYCMNLSVRHKIFL